METEVGSAGYVFPPPPIASLPVAGTAQRFPVRRIYCIGVNYRRATPPEGAAKIPEGQLIIFHKHPDALVADGEAIPFPPATQTLVGEVELVVAIGMPGESIAAASALQHVFGYAVGNDLTRADLMLAALRSGGAVDVAKAFDCSAPCGPVFPAATVGHPTDASLWLRVDGELRQEGNLTSMQRSTAELIAALSRLYRLEAGDLIYSGTPALPATVQRGQTVVCGIDGLGSISNRIR